MKILIFIILFTSLLFSQQINYTWGYTTSGTAYNQTGYPDADSSTTISIIFDMQDYFWQDWRPFEVTGTGTITGFSASDSVGLDSIAGTITFSEANNSSRQYFGTFWYHSDAKNATDSVGYAIKAYPGNLIYHPNDGSRITTSNINFGTTATTIIDTGTTRAVNDIQWTPYNIYLNYTAGKFLPPEFLKLTITFQNNAADSLDNFWNFAYPSVYEYYQKDRGTTRSNKNAVKRDETLH